MTQDAKAPSEGAAEPTLDRSLPPSGVTEPVSALVRRRICVNGGPFTVSGTCSYIVGRDRVAIIDPGPDDPDHVAALAAAVSGARVEAIVVTHTHRDHSPGARLLQALTGASIVGCGPHRAARDVTEREMPHLDASADWAHRPDRLLVEGDRIEGPGWSLVAVETPGHTMNHLAFALPEEAALFSGDHVMAWSTTVVAPPDGSMRAYLASLERLRDRTETVYWPGHGGPVRDPARLVRGLSAHRRQREASIRARIEAGDRDVRTIVEAIYKGLRPELIAAAGLSVFAHLEDLVARDLVRCDGPARIEGRFEPA